MIGYLSPNAEIRPVHVSDVSSGRSVRLIDPVGGGAECRCQLGNLNIGEDGVEWRPCQCESESGLTVLYEVSRRMTVSIMGSCPVRMEQEPMIDTVILRENGDLAVVPADVGTLAWGHLADHYIILYAVRERFDIATIAEGATDPSLRGLGHENGGPGGQAA